MKSSESPVVGGKCLVGKQEELPSMWDRATITGGDQYARLCGQYSKTEHAAQDKAREASENGPQQGGPQTISRPWPLTGMGG
jgi:hypothetical protein